MIYELNIGLDVNGGDNSKQERLARLSSLFATFQWPADPLEYKVVGGLDSTDEPALYVRIDLDVMAMIDLGWQLCDFLNQDCIAVYIPEQRAGLLVGPRAAAWGEFNPEYFRRPAVAVAA